MKPRDQLLEVGHRVIKRLGERLHVAAGREGAARPRQHDDPHLAVDPGLL
jgi:hypothetical protein